MQVDATIEVIIRFRDGTDRCLIFDDLRSLQDWLEKRWVHVDSFTARSIEIKKMRQGRA